MRIMSEEPYFSLLSSPRHGFDDAVWPYHNIDTRIMLYPPEEAAMAGNPRNANASRGWMQQVLSKHSVSTFEMRQALESLGGLSTDDLRMLTRADLASRTNMRVAEFIFEALDSNGRTKNDVSLSDSSLDSLPSEPYPTSFPFDYDFDDCDETYEPYVRFRQPIARRFVTTALLERDAGFCATETSEGPASAQAMPQAMPAPSGEAAAVSYATLRSRTSSEGSTCSSAASEPPRRRGGRPKRPTNPSRRPSGRARQAAPTGRLWQFLMRLLNDEQYSPGVIRWEDKDNGVFCFVHGHRVAEMWGKLKGNSAMTYEKMTRTMRTYKNNAFEPHPKRLVYKFGKVALAPAA